MRAMQNTIKKNLHGIPQVYSDFLNPRVKVLNPVRQDYFQFFMEQNALTSRCIPTLGMKNIPRYLDWNTDGMSFPTHKMVSHPSIRVSHQNLNPCK